MSTREPFNKLVKMVARAFYDDKNMKGDNQQKTGRSDNRGMAVVVLDALTRRQWVREEDLAKDLKLHAKQLRRTLRFFEEEKLITRDHRKETAKGAKIFSAAVAATSNGQIGKEGEEKLKLHTHSYCCLDFAQIYDVVRYRLHRMRKEIKDSLGDKHTIQEYKCNKCHRRYTAFDAARLISPMDDCFRCENCNEELVADSEKFATEEGGDKDDVASRRQNRQRLEDILEKMEMQLKPLTDQLNLVKGLAPPEFGSLQSWEAQVNAGGRRNGESNTNDSSNTSEGQGYAGAQVSFVGETKVEVALPGTGVKEEDIKPDAGTMKVLPPWMIKQGMQLTNEQRGEVKQNLNLDTGSGSAVTDDKKPIVHETEDEKIKDEYVKAYYAAVLQRQQEQNALAKQQESAMVDTLGGRLIGMKSKYDDDEADDDVDWEEDTPNTGNTMEHRNVDLNVEADAIEEDEDDIDWEED